MSRRYRIFGPIGGKLDDFEEGERHTKWRPSVELARKYKPKRMDFVVISRFREVAERAVEDIREVSPETEVVLHHLAEEPGWDFEANFAAYFDVAHSLTFDPETEDLLVHITTGNYVTQICTFLLTESRHLPGRLVMTDGHPRATPFTIVDFDTTRYDRIASRFAKAALDGTACLKDGISTRNPAYNALIECLERMCATNRAPIVLMGPTGAGKSELARRIYELLKARNIVTGPFVEVDCGTLMREQARSELFGHARGAFTGAVDAHVGFLKEADGGVLFLDEVGELGLGEQLMLLRAIEKKVFRPLGAPADIRSDFRLICGTNRDLEAEVRAGRFRLDLLARIGRWRFTLPGLADRMEDFEPNLDRELERCVHEIGRRASMNHDARARYLDFARSAPWPANFRDLADSVARMATLAVGGRITVREVETEITTLLERWVHELHNARPGVPASPLETPRADAALGARAGDYDVFDKVQLEAVLAACAVSRTLSEAGRRLFGVSLPKQKRRNDAQRVRSLLARFELSRDGVGLGSALPAGANV